MTWRPCFTNNDDDHYQGLLREMHANAFILTQILIILLDVVPNLVIICLNSLKNAETTITTLEVQNYHFAMEAICSV